MDIIPSDEIKVSLKFSVYSRNEHEPKDYLRSKLNDCAHAYNFTLPQALQIHKPIGRCSTENVIRMVRAMFGIRAGLRGAKAPCIS